MTRRKKSGVCFTVYAPHAKAVFVVGDFNDWNETSHEMKRLKPVDAGVYELFVTGLKTGSLYKYLIITQDDRKLYKADLHIHITALRQIPQAHAHLLENAPAPSLKLPRYYAYGNSLSSMQNPLAFHNGTLARNILRMIGNSTRQTRMQILPR